jgi:hypothetical protein
VDAERLTGDGGGAGVVLTCFAGRRRNMELLLAYTDELHSRGLLDEVHIWDFSRDRRDADWLVGEFQRSPFLATGGYDYRPAGITLGEAERGELLCRCGGNAHVLLVAPGGRPYAEISLGAYGNSCSFLRDGPQGSSLSVCGRGLCDPFSWRRIGVSAENGSVTVSVDGEKVMSATLEGVEFPTKVMVAGWNGAEEVRWKLPDGPERGRRHPYARLFGVRNKGSWREYYQHYTEQLYPDSVIIKSDDDIVFLDVDSFGDFIRHRREDEGPLLLFPGIVNNGVCARHQQEAGIIPKSLGNFAGGGATDCLWRSGKLCRSLHESFTKDAESWLKRAGRAKETVRVPIGERVSINFFAILPKDLYAFQMVGQDDERELTVDIPRRLGRHNSIRLDMTVSHLSFYKQRDEGLNEGEAITMYRRLARDRFGKKWQERML